MPLASPLSKTSMSLEELATCEDFLDSHREYAIELLSDIEAIRQWHRADNCPETRNGRPCPLCELCDDNGLLGVTKKVLETYEGADDHLKQVRVSLGKNAVGRGASGPQTLFTSQLAKAVFFSIATVGESLQSQHATWSVRLQGIVANLCTPSPRHVNAGSGDTDKNSKGNALPPTCVGSTIIGSEANLKLSALVPGFAPTSNASMFLGFRRCLASDCCCDASEPHATSKVPPPPLGSKKTRKHKTTRSLATNPPDRSKKARDTLTQPSTDGQTDPATRASDTPNLQGVMPREHEPSGPASDATLSTQETETFSPSQECEALIVDPRVFRLREELVRSNVARRALMDWCQAWVAELRLDPQERHGTGRTNELTRGTHGCTSVLEPQRSRHTTGKVGEVTTKELSHGDDGTTALEMQFNSQEELKVRWLTAQRARSKRPEKRFSLSVSQ